MSNNSQNINRLAGSIINSKLSHAYIFEGQNREETNQIAKEFVMGIFCEKQSGTPCGICEYCMKFKHENLEDFILVKSSGNSVKDEDIIYLQRRLRNKPFSALRNVAIIENADAMTIRAQNRLLKTLEEPNGNNIIILIANNKGNLISTIQSRCVNIKVNDNYEININDQLVLEYDLIKIAQIIATKKSLHDFNQHISNISKDRESAKEGLEILESWFRNMLLNKTKGWSGENIQRNTLDNLSEIEKDVSNSSLVNIIENIEIAKTDLDANVNVAYALKSMLLKIQEEENDKCNRN